MPHAVEYFHFPFEQLRWLDELGVSAAMEQDIVCKQTFIGSHYAMLDAQYNPLPVSSVGKKKGLQGTKGVCICMYTLLVQPSLVLSALGFCSVYYNYCKHEEHSEWTC